MAKKLRCGVIGLGMGKGHIKGYQSHPQAEVVAIADLNADLLSKVGDDFDVPGRYDSAKAMLAQEKLDVVSVVAPNKFHKPLTIAALEAGCHVLCEKPIAMNAREGQAMVDMAEKARKRLMINFAQRFADQSVALKKQVDAGVLGDIYFGRTTWHRRRGIPKFGGWFGQKALAGGGPLVDIGVHRLDMALWLMGFPEPTWVMGGTYNAVASVLARKQRKKFDVEDLAAAMIRFENGAMLVLEASWAANIAEKELMETRLFGAKGGLVQRNVGEGYQYEAEIYVEREGCQFDMKLHPPVPAAQSSYYHFIDAIVSRKPHIATGEEGLVVMEILDAIYRSAEKGQPVRV